MNSTNSSILVVSPDAKLRGRLAGILALANYSVTVVESFDSVHQPGTAGTSGLVILGLAGMDDAVPELERDLAQAIGGLIVVAEPTAIARLTLLELEVDAYIPKPFTELQFLAQVARLLKRGQSVRAEMAREREFLTFEGFTLDIPGHSLFNPGGQEVELTRAEFALLVALLRRPGTVLSREQLLGSMARNPDEVYDRSIDVMVWRLRKKIELNPRQPRLITTVPGAGYKFAAKVRPIEARKELNAEAYSGDEPRARPQTVERRHATVLACELIGLNSASSQLEPEEVRALVGAYRHACSEITSEFGAPETRFSGEGIQFYFGYPSAHEHDAERAVRAGILIIDALAALAPGIAANLRARIGIASGVVIVGDLSGSGAGADIVGEASSLASRLCSMAPPNGIWISSQTRELVGDLFLYRSVGPDIPPDGDEPTTAWQVCGEGHEETRFDALRSKRLSPIVGRKEELELMLRRWRQSAAAHGSTVLISGEPGIGKSRLVKAFAQEIESESHEKLYYQCSPYHQNSPLYPLIAQIERTAGFERDNSAERRLDKLERMISAAGIDPTNGAPLLALLLSLPTSQRYPPVALGPAQQRRRTLAVLLDLVTASAMRRPLLLIFEDVHWADATSLEWLDLVTNMARRLSIVILLTHRSDFKPAWLARPNVTTLVIGRLEPQDVRTIIGGISSGHQLSASVIERIVRQTDGIPLYVEELTKMVIESALLPRGIGSDAPTFAIPLTLQDSLSARVDRLGSAREVAQIGAAIGRDFSYELLRGLVTLDQPTLESALTALEVSELLFRHGVLPGATYSFAHALVQEAAYEALPKSRRRALHQRIAELLTEPTTSLAEVEPEVVAQHYALAGDDEAAAQWWGRSGDRAIGRSAYVEAASNFGKAVVLALRIAPNPQQHRLLLRLQIGYGHALIASRGHGAPETTAAFAQARALAAGIEDGSERLSAMYGMWSGSFCRAELDPMQMLADRFARNVEGSPELREARVVAERLLGVTAWFRGDYIGARGHLERSVAIYDNEQHGALALRFGQDVGVCAMVYLALVLWTLGDSSEARRWMETAHALAMRMNHVPTIAYMRMHECALACIAGDPQTVLPPAQALVEMSRQHGLPLWMVGGTFCLGWALWHAGDLDAGLSQMRDAMDLCREHGAIFMPNYAFLRAEAEAAAGSIETALTLVIDQLAEIERSGQRWLEAELHRRHAELLIRRTPTDAAGAEAAFTRAISVARSQHARTFELRAAIGLAQFYREQSRIDAARDVLAAARDAPYIDVNLPEARQVESIHRLLVRIDRSDRLHAKARPNKSIRRIKLKGTLVTSVVRTSKLR